MWFLFLIGVMIAGVIMLFANAGYPNADVHSMYSAIGFVMAFGGFWLFIISGVAKFFWRVAKKIDRELDR